MFEIANKRTFKTPSKFLELFGTFTSRMVMADD